MDRNAINKFCARAPIVMSLLALGIVFAAAMTGWESELHGEGAGAHLFQVLIGAEIPVSFAYLATANWSKIREVIGSLTLQAGALSVAMGAVLIFGS